MKSKSNFSWSSQDLNIGRTVIPTNLLIHTPQCNCDVSTSGFTGPNCDLSMISITKKTKKQKIPNTKYQKRKTKNEKRKNQQMLMTVHQILVKMVPPVLMD